MKKFITARPEAEMVGFGSAYRPVLAGVAHGLTRLFPPVQSPCAPQDGRGEGMGEGMGEDRHPRSSRTAEASGGGARR